MAKKSKIFIISIFGIILLLIVIISVKKVYDNHVSSMYLVVSKNIEENAKQCFLENVCTGEETTLGFLINSGYIEKQIDPMTKEYISEEVVITYDGENCKVDLS